jgi:hypothetical protein
VTVPVIEELNVVDVAPAQIVMPFEVGTMHDEASLQVPMTSPPHAGAFAQLPPSASEPQPARNVERPTPTKANRALLMTKQSQIVDDLDNLGCTWQRAGAFPVGTCRPMVETLVPS